MAVTNYYTVNAELIGEHTAGASRLDYLPDALGSVIGAIDQTLTVQVTARYKPYGADLATTGTMPYFGWDGRYGYRRTGRPHSDMYAQSRHVGSIEGRWTAVDIIWPWEHAYGYVVANPVLYADPTGTQIIIDKPKPVYPPSRVPSPPLQKAPSPPPPTVPYPRSPLPPEEPVGPGVPEGPVTGACATAGLTVALTLLPTTLGSGMNPVSFRFPRVLLERNSKVCDQMHDKYEVDCKAQTRCTSNMRSCATITNNFNAARNCINQRIAYIQACDPPGGGGKDRNACNHAQQACARVKNLQACFEAAQQNNCPGFGGMTIWDYMNYCLGMRKQCPKTTGFPNFP